MSKIEQDVFDLASPIAGQKGCTVVDVEYKKQKDGMYLTVFIDKPSGVTLDDCEAVHNAIDQPLDELDPTNGVSYILRVSSPGLDRDINNNKSLELALGKEIDIKLFAAFEGKKQFDSVKLVSFSDLEIVVLQNNKQISLPRKLISKITKTINI